MKIKCLSRKVKDSHACTETHRQPKTYSFIKKICFDAPYHCPSRETNWFLPVIG